MTNSTCMINGNDIVEICVPPPTQDITQLLPVRPFVMAVHPPYYMAVCRNLPTTVQWVQTGGPIATIVSPMTPVTEITGLDGMSTYTFSYTITNPVTGCSSSATATITFGVPGSTLDITTPDPIIKICDDKTVTLTYTQLGSGEVQWRVAASPNGILTNWATAGSSPFTILNLYGVGNPIPPGAYVIEMRKNNPVGLGCSNGGADQVTVIFSESITASNAGTESPCLAAFIRRC